MTDKRSRPGESLTFDFDAAFPAPPSPAPPSKSPEDPPVTHVSNVPVPVPVPALFSSPRRRRSRACIPS